MANKYAEDLRRIVGIREEQRGLEAAKNRVGIGTATGISYMDKNGNPDAVSGSSSGTAPTKANTTTDPTKKPVSQQGGNADTLKTEYSGFSYNNSTYDALGRSIDPGGSLGGGSSGTGTSGGSGSYTQTQNNKGGAGGTGNYTVEDTIKGKETGQYTAQEIFNNAGPDTGNSIVSPDGQQISGGKLLELVATDCNSGKEMRIRTDGLYTPPEATYSSATDQTALTLLRGAWTTPEDGVSTAVADDLVYLLNTWNALPSYQGPQWHALQSTAVTLAHAWVESYISYDHTSTLANTSPEMILNIVGWNAASTAGYQATVSAMSCDLAGAPAVTAGVCPIASPSISYIWPNTGWYDQFTRSPKLTQEAGESFILSFTGGKFKPHPNDPNVPSSFAGGVSKVDFCFDNGRYGKMEPLKTGGFAIYETSGAGGAADGVIRLYDSTGAANGFADSTILSPLQAAQNLPPSY